MLPIRATRGSQFNTSGKKQIQGTQAASSEAYYVAGEAFELLEALAHTFYGVHQPLGSQGPCAFGSPPSCPQRPAGPAAAPLLALLGPAAKEHLGLGTISMEWLSAARQQQVFAAEPPFDHEYLLQVSASRQTTARHPVVRMTLNLVIFKMLPNGC